MDVSTDFLRTFIAACECKSFSHATAVVHKTQGAISAQIAKLEEQTGGKLLDRSQRPLRLTEAGILFFKFAKEIIEKIDEVNRSLQELTTGIEEEVKIGATRAVATYILPRMIRSVLSDFPKLKLLLLAQPRPVTYEYLNQGKIDFAIVLSDTIPDGFVTTCLRTEPLYFITSAKHRLARKKIVSRKQLSSIPFIAGIKGNEISDIVDRTFEINGIPKPSAGCRIGNLEARKEAARAGFGVTVLPRFVVRDDIYNKTLTTFIIKDLRLPDTRIMTVERRQHSLNPSAELVKKILQEKIKSR